MQTPATITVKSGRRSTDGTVQQITEAKGQEGIEIDLRSASGACLCCFTLPRDQASKFVQDLARELTLLHLA
jgi:hypothetical protein